MGFFSAIGGAISSIGSAIGSACSAIGSAVSSCASALASSVGSIVKTLSPIVGTIGNVLGKINMVATVICAVVQVVSVICGLLKQDENMEELGEKALEAEEDGVTLETYDGDMQKYLDYLRSRQIDPEKANNRPQYQKLFAAASILDRGIKEMAPQYATSSIWPLITANASSDFFKPERIRQYMDVADASHLTLSELIDKCFNPAKENDTGIDPSLHDLIWKAERALNPNASDSEIESTLTKVAENVKEAGQKILDESQKE